MEVVQEINKILENRYEELSKSSSVNNESLKSNQRFFIFKINENLFATSALEIEEISEFINPTPLPNVEDFIVGIINLRGSIISVVDIRKFINEETKENYNEETARLLVINNGHFNMALLINEMIEKVELKNNDTKTIDMESSKSSILTGFIKYQDSEIAYINLKRFSNIEQLIINQ